MKKTFSLEILILLFAGAIGVLICEINKWWISLIVSIILFGACSYLIEALKKETIKEYIIAKEKIENANHNKTEQEKGK